MTFFSEKRFLSYTAPESNIINVNRPEIAARVPIRKAHAKTDVISLLNVIYYVDYYLVLEFRSRGSPVATYSYSKSIVLLVRIIRYRAQSSVAFAAART